MKGSTTKVKKPELRAASVELAGLCARVAAQARILRSARQRSDLEIVDIAGRAILEGQAKIRALATSASEGEDEGELNLRLQIVRLRDGLQLEPYLEEGQ